MYLLLQFSLSENKTHTSSQVTLALKLQWTPTFHCQHHVSPLHITGVFVSLVKCSKDKVLITFPFVVHQYIEHFEGSNWAKHGIRFGQVCVISTKALLESLEPELNTAKTESPSCGSLMAEDTEDPSGWTKCLCFMFLERCLYSVHSWLFKWRFCRYNIAVLSCLWSFGVLLDFYANVSNLEYQLFLNDLSSAV